MGLHLLACQMCWTEGIKSVKNDVTIFPFFLLRFSRCLPRHVVFNPSFLLYVLFFQFEISLRPGTKVPLCRQGVELGRKSGFSSEVHT